jgi:hypothetical protein
MEFLVNAPLVTCKVFFDKPSIRTAEVIDAIGQVFADVNLAIGVCDLVYDLPNTVNH